MTVKQRAKAQAIRDIKKELRAHNQTFMAFIKELNPVMDKLVDEQLEGQEKQGQADEDGCPGLRSDSGGRLHQKPEEGHAKILPLFPAVFALAKKGRDRGQAGRVKEPVQEKPRLRLAFVG